MNLLDAQIKLIIHFPVIRDALIQCKSDVSTLCLVEGAWRLNLISYSHFLGLPL